MYVLIIGCFFVEIICLMWIKGEINMCRPLSVEELEAESDKCSICGDPVNEDTGLCFNCGICPKCNYSTDDDHECEK